MNNPQKPGQQRSPMTAMGRGGGVVAGGEKARDFGGTVRKLLDYQKAYRVALIVAVFFAIASTVFTVIGPKILGLATTKLFAGVKILSFVG